MPAVGGDITEITYNHPTIGQGTLFPKANEGNTLDPGGIRTSDDASMIDGTGQPIWHLYRVRGSLEILCANDMNTRNDIEVVRQLQESSLPADWTFTMINETVWGCSGKPVGDIAADVNASTFTLKIASGNFKKIVG